MPRYRCSGPVRIMNLPWEGSWLCGRIRNLGFGGCLIEDVSNLICGTRTEIVLRLERLSLRVVGEVRTVRSSNVGVQFIRMSSRAEHLLSDFLEELERQQHELLRVPLASKPGHSAEKLLLTAESMDLPFRRPLIAATPAPEIGEGITAELECRLRRWNPVGEDSSLDLFF